MVSSCQAIIQLWNYDVDPDKPRHRIMFSIHCLLQDCNLTKGESNNYTNLDSEAMACLLSALPVAKGD